MLTGGLDIVQRWFTADMHFWHASMLSERFNLTHRRERWSGVEEMTIDLVREWRDTVGPHDVVYHVGDLFHRCGSEKVKRLLRDLSGYWIFLAPGNHDRERLLKLQAQGHVPYNVKILPDGPVMLDTRIGMREVFLGHYPPDQCEGFAELPADSIYLHGHSHGQRRQQLPHRALDVGWDAHQRILSYDEICTHFEVNHVQEAD